MLEAQVWQRKILKSDSTFQPLRNNAALTDLFFLSTTCRHLFIPYGFNPSKMRLKSRWDEKKRARARRERIKRKAR